MREATGQIAGFETGDYGRILSRNGAPFAYDGVGRRLDDDRFVYRWDWRGQLVSATVKDTWSDSDGDGAPDVTPFAGHQVRYEYDAAGRLTHRWHYGKLPEGATDDAQRPFIEKRVFVWEGSSLAAEAAYNHDEALRWRKTYVPGPSGLDDAVQVVVEDAASATTRTYTLLRDELGTVLGLVAEDEGSDPANPPVPVRYRYTPYGEAHAESGPELLRARFDSQATAVQTASGTTTQAVSNETTAAAGSLVLDWSLSLDPATLPANLLVESLAPGTGWVALSPEEAVVGIEPTEGGISAGGGGPPARLLVLTRSGWLRGTSYRVRLTSGLTDDLGRRFGRTETLEWRGPEAPASGPIPAITFDKKVAPRFETWEAATDTATGRFPGGQTALFQGLWTDPVTGVAYARARWFDARNASWLSEDPLLDVDSPNLYAFVGLQPNSGIDPLGTCDLGHGVLFFTTDRTPCLVSWFRAGQAAHRWTSRFGDGFEKGLGESVFVWADRVGSAVKTLALHPEVIDQKLTNTIKGALTVGMAVYGADQDAMVLYVTDAAAEQWRQLAEADPYELGRSLGHDAPVIILTEGAGELVFAARGARYTDEFADFLDDLPRYKSTGRPATLDTPEPRPAVSSPPSGNIVYGELDALGRPTGIQATITEDMIGTGTDAARSIRPPGFGGQAAGHARGHLLGKQLGGSGKEYRNLVTLYQNPANSPIMRDFENKVRAAVEAGEVVQYRVTPIYQGNAQMPAGVTLEAEGSAGFRLNVTVLNRQ